MDVFFALPQVEALSAWGLVETKATAQAHEAGDFTSSARMYWAMLTDPRVADGVSKRALALRGMPFEVRPGLGREARTVARKFREAMGLGDQGAAGPNRIVRPEVAAELFGQALLMGQAIAQPEWSYADDGWYYPRLGVWEPALTRWQTCFSDTEEQGHIYALVRGSERGDIISGQVPVITGTGQWVRFSLAGDERPWMHGRMRAIWRPWIARLLALLSWLRYNDVHGMPIRAAKVPMGMRKTDEMAQFYANVRNIGRDASLMMPQMPDGKTGVGLDLIEAKSESWRSFQALLYDCGTEITISLTGGTQNAEAVGGNYKGAEEQREIRHEVKAADAVSWATTLNEQLCVPFAVLNGYDPSAAPQIVYDTRPPPNRRAEAEASKAEFDAIASAAAAHAALEARGVRVPLADLLRARGIMLPSSAQAGEPMPQQPPTA